MLNQRKIGEAYKATLKLNFLPTSSAHDQVKIEETRSPTPAAQLALKLATAHMLVNLCPPTANETRAPLLVPVLDTVLPRQVVVDGGRE